MSEIKSVIIQTGSANLERGDPGAVEIGFYFVSGLNLTMTDESGKPMSKPYRLAPDDEPRAVAGRLTRERWLKTSGGRTSTGGSTIPRCQSPSTGPLMSNYRVGLSQDRSDGATSALVLLFIASGAAMGGNEFWWIGGAIGAIGLVITMWLSWGRPFLRRVKLKRPVRAHFTSRDNARSASGRDVSDGDPHLIRHATVPANATLEIEVGIDPLIHFKAHEIVIGAKGDRNSRPQFLRRTFSFIRGGGRPSSEQDYTDAAGYLHIKADKPYNVGTHFVFQLELQTKSAGRYPVVLSFLTDEIEGNFEKLELLVEDTPITNMRCHAKGHGLNCMVKAAPMS